MFKSKRIEQQNAVRRLLEIKDHKTNDMLKKVIQKIFDTLKASLSVLAKAHENSNSEDGRIQFDKKIANGKTLVTNKYSDHLKSEPIYSILALLFFKKISKCQNFNHC
jgi:hypothetical protein